MRSRLGKVCTGAPDALTSLGACRVVHVVGRPPAPTCASASRMLCHAVHQLRHPAQYRNATTAASDLLSGRVVGVFGRYIECIEPRPGKLVRQQGSREWAGIQELAQAGEAHAGTYWPA